jgi:hypothetical protein
MTIGEPYHTRFVSRIRIDPSDCWVWEGGKNQRGYGQFGMGVRNMQLAHRVSYRLFVGNIPEDAHIDHLCRNPVCVNPRHLEAVSCRENLVRGKGTIAGRNSHKTHCPHGHAYTAENTYNMPSGGRSCRECQRIRRRKK